MTTHVLASYYKGQAWTLCGLTGQKSLGSIHRKHVDCDACIQASTPRWPRQTEKEEAHAAHDRP